MRLTYRFIALFAVFALLSLTACSGSKWGEGYTNPNTDRNAKENRSQEGIFGEGGLNFGGKKKGEEGGAGIGVNGYLWRATLDTLAFMPLVSADPFGGVVITDWYSPTTATPVEGTPSASERFKVTVYILAKELRSDGLKVSAFKQVLQNGNWVDAAVDPQTATQLENAILNRAREIRIAEGK